MVNNLNRKLKNIKNESWITMLFLAIQLLVFIVMTGVGLVRGFGLSGTHVGGILYEFGAMLPSAVILNHEYWRFITPIFIHIGFMHLLFNSVFLYFAGRDLEEVMGHTSFFFFYLLAGIAGNVFSFAFGQPEIISAGASTSLFGIFGAFIAIGRIFPYNPKIQYMAKNMLTMAAINLLMNVFSSGVDILGHIGGLVAGLLLGFAFSAPKLKVNRYDVTGEDNIHRRIVCGIGYVIAIVAMIYYSTQKYGFFL